jgi:hypothetical protein
MTTSWPLMWTMSSPFRSGSNYSLQRARAIPDNLGRSASPNARRYLPHRYRPLYEEISYDDAGQPLVGTLGDYLLPGAVEMPAIKIGHLHIPTPYTEYGMKSMGEGGAVAPPAAIANAVRDALAEIGAEVNETPITPRRVLTAIKAARVAASSKLWHQDRSR